MQKIITVIFITIFFSLCFSCKKTTPAEANITVLDTLNRPVAGASVVLRQDSVINPNTGVRADIFQEKITASDGNAHFEFDWEAVLNVEITKDVLSGKDYIRLEQSKTVNKSIIIK